ncbi:hypothetical protein AUJ42_03150 [Candidatus Collierbacteria bacterium CG1_02_44_10]|uniref:Glutamyl-tRNA amidotransferase n=4 Tax=Candidatus Collieribacteriota TaxID=1752725 RepID=A0A2H0DUM2_9BACT|nr:GatB/YqeY domain-containing protein [bacterium]OIN90341.1 MAG: hypothetical protein AUJ42_03150 [Candidatus Collierbacteria bacterium CG1_02_44_10]PIP85896.1 MAG: glutamyl-tRNA amidotransferase [Candidatus Collierbacteria bacterium CG22_combo_CG10-13_8_21_14_all_43_12]PIR99660.1 MAG: glutamyl-tRNA amidotransferase [Candidatus Collierbacteria bacterium CG10_big_fil_rev_8_21_14_0_10_43_36]PIZ24828.1 MAG: glutamyl-tRNA amidotransferase [Candidatus Collierbacteria bacterium CG_4_10_14_0_8_um_fil
MLYSKIRSDLTTAQKAGDTHLVGVLKLIASELSYAQVDFKGAMPAGRHGDLPDEEVVRVLMKEAKKRKDSIEIYIKVGSPERLAEEKYELKVIEGYLPQMLSEEEVTAEVIKIASETGLSGGRLMGAVMGKLRGKADGSVVQKVVNQKFP